MSSDSHTLKLPAPEPKPLDPSTRWLLGFIAGALALLAPVCVWQMSIRDRVLPRRWCEVEPGQLYRSAQLSPQQLKKMLRSEKIQVILDLSPEGEPSEEQLEEQRLATSWRVEYHRIPLEEGSATDLKPLARAVQLIQQSLRQNKPVLVHCRDGAVRTGAVLSVWKLLVANKPKIDVYHELIRYGWSESDDVYQARLNSDMRQIAGWLVENQTILAVPERLEKIGG